jgi:hypothetical protein
LEERIGAEKQEGKKLKAENRSRENIKLKKKNVPSED